MWDYLHENGIHLSHDLPCLACGHGGHRYLPCDQGCECAGTSVPGRYEDELAEGLLALR